VVDINALGTQGTPTKHRDMDRYDVERLEFIQELDGANLDVTDWEADFIDSNLDRCIPFTPAQREAVVNMRDKYEGLL